MNNLPEDIQNTIFKYKHQMEFTAVLEQLDAVLWKSKFDTVIQYIRKYGASIKSDMAGMAHMNIFDNEYEDLFTFNVLNYHLD
jgi:hypothetical protein